MAAAVVPGLAKAQRLTLDFAASRLAPYVLWPAALLSWALVIVKARFGGGDLFEIWKGIHSFDGGHPIYFQNGSTMSFLYPPSAAMLLAPLGALPFARAEIVFAIAQAIAISCACVMALRLVGRKGRVLVPIAVLAASLLLPARNSTWLGNVDGLIVALEVLALLAAARNRWTTAGALLGVSLALKPVLIPLLLVFILARHWRALAVAIALPIGLSLVALSFSADGAAFVTRVVPFLAAGQSSQLENVNISLSGGILAAHLPSALLVALRGLVAGLLVVLVAMRWNAKELLGNEAIRLAEVSGLIMLGVLLTFSYAWAHYVLFLLPLFALFGLRQSVVRGYIAAAAAYLLLFPDNDLWAKASFAASQLRLTLGLLLLLSSIVLLTLRARQRSVSQGPAPAAASSSLSS